MNDKITAEYVLATKIGDALIGAEAVPAMRALIITAVALYRASGLDQSPKGEEAFLRTLLLDACINMNNTRKEDADVLH
jgi:hypothetical protein